MPLQIAPSLSVLRKRPPLRGRSAFWGSGFGGSYANRRITRGVARLSHGSASHQGRSALRAPGQAFGPA
jgi:hypothetical protein